MSSRSRTKLSSRPRTTSRSKTPSAKSSRSRSQGSVIELNSASRVYDKSFNVYNAISYARELVEKDYPNFANKGWPVVLQFNKRDTTFNAYKDKSKGGVGYYNFSGRLIGAEGYKIVLPICNNHGRLDVYLPKLLTANGFKNVDRESYTQFLVFCIMLSLCLMGVFPVPNFKRGGKKNRTRKRGGFAGTFIILLLFALITMNTGLAAANPTDGADKPKSLVEINAENEKVCNKLVKDDKNFNGWIGRHVGPEQQAFDACMVRKNNAAIQQLRIEMERENHIEGRIERNKVQEATNQNVILQLLAGLVTSVLTAFLTYWTLGRNKPASADISKNETDKKKAQADQQREQQKIDENNKKIIEYAGKIEEVEIILEKLDSDIKSIDDELKKLTENNSELESEKKTLNTKLDDTPRSLKPKVLSQITQKTQEIEDLEKTTLNLKEQKKIIDDQIHQLNLFKTKITTEIKKLEHDSKSSASSVATNVKTIADLNATLSQQRKLSDEIAGKQMQEAIELIPEVGDFFQKIIQSQNEQLKAKSTDNAEYRKGMLAIGKTQLDIIQDIGAKDFDARQDARDFGYSKNTVPIALAAGAAASTIVAVGTAGGGAVFTPAIMGAAVTAGTTVSTGVLAVRGKGLRGKGDQYATAAVEQGKALIGAFGDVAQSSVSILDARQKETRRVADAENFNSQLTAVRNFTAKQTREQAIVAHLIEDLSGRKNPSESERKELAKVKSTMISLNADSKIAQDTLQTLMKNAPAGVVHTFEVPDFMKMTPEDLALLRSVTEKSRYVADALDSAEKKKTEEMKTKQAKEAAAEKQRQKEAEKQRQEEEAAERRKRDDENLLKRAAQMRKDAEAAAAKAAAPTVAPTATGRKLGKSKAKSPSPAKKEEGEIEEEKSRPRGPGS